MRHQQSTTNHQLSTINHQLSSIHLTIIISVLISSSVPAQEFGRWRLPDDWDLSESFWEDVDRDGVAELILLRRRRLQVWKFGGSARATNQPGGDADAAPLRDANHTAAPRTNAAEAPFLTTSIPDRYVCFTLGGLINAESGGGGGGREDPPMLYLLSAAGVDRLALTDRAQPETVLESASDVAPLPGKFPRADFLIDLNGDGVREIILPANGCWRIFRRDGARWEQVFEFGRPASPWIQFSSQPLNRSMLLAVPPNSPFSAAATWAAFQDEDQPAIYHSSADWPLDRLWIYDFNGDALPDLVTSGAPPAPPAENRGQSPAWQPRALAVALQNTSGGFELMPVVYPPEPAKRDDSSGGRIKSPAEEAAGAYTVIYHHFDIDGDGLADQVQVEVGDDVMLPKTRITVRINPGRENNFNFDAVKPLVLRARCVLPGSDLGSALADVNGDGALDLSLIQLEIQAASTDSMLESFLSRGVKGKLGVYFWNATRGYGSSPDLKFPLNLRYDMFGIQDLEGGVFRFGDFNGDGRTDLALKVGSDEIAIHLMIDEKKGFAETAWQRIRMSGGARSGGGSTGAGGARLEAFQLLEVNADRRSDVLVITRDPDHPARFAATLFYSTGGM